MRQNAVGGKGGHGAAKPHAVIHRYVFRRRSHTPFRATLNALAGGTRPPSLQAPGFSARITPPLTRSIFITPLSPRPLHFVSLAAALAAPLVRHANDRQPMQALHRSDESHASFCSPPSALPYPNSSSPCSNSSCGITPKFHYTIRLDARDTRRAENNSLEHTQLQPNSQAWCCILRQDEIHLRASHGGQKCSARLPPQAIWKVAHRLYAATLPWIPVSQAIRRAFRGMWMWNALRARSACTHHLYY
jgi:hypothetical protein